jgi:hypothetical protein
MVIDRAAEDRAENREVFVPGAAVVVFPDVRYVFSAKKK